VKKSIIGWGVTNKNIIAIPTGVEEEFFVGSDRQLAREKMGIKIDEKAILLVSRLTAEKNVQFLVDAVLEVLKKNLKIKFILAGGGSELLKLKKMIVDAGMLDRVIFKGIVLKNKVKNIYAAGDIFVYASKSETQGMVLTEAMYAGLPIVAVNAMGVKDIVGNQITGILVKENKQDFVDAVVRLLNDENLCKKFSENAKKSANENYTNKICTQKMFELYREVIERKKTK
jgi:glycosyltransferase involved in cell wall biosynthesis